MQKQIAQEVLAKELIPEGSTVDDLLGMLRAASSMCKMDEAENHECPLCKRNLGIPEIELFKQYHGLIVGELEKNITALKADITKAREIATVVGQFDPKEWDKCKTISEEILTAAAIWFGDYRRQLRHLQKSRQRMPRRRWSY